MTLESSFTRTGFVHEQREMRVVFRPGCTSVLAAEADRLGVRRIAVIAAPRYAARSADELGSRIALTIEDARMHVPRDQAELVRTRCAENSVDGLVAVGGGSAVGLAKAVALALRIPIIAVPTTYSGSEMTRVWGLTEGGVKRTGRDPVVAPRVVLYDPDLLATFPAALAVPSAFNALAHAIEARYAPDRTPLTDLIADAAVTATVNALPQLAAGEPAAQSEALYGAWLCGMSLDATTMSLHHKLCHVLGGSFGLPHAPTHTIVLPHVLGYNAEYAPEAAAVVAAALPGAPEGRVAGRALQQFATSLGAPTRLTELGLGREHLDEVVESVLASPYANPAPLDRVKLLDLMARAWEGLPVAG